LSGSDTGHPEKRSMMRRPRRRRDSPGICSTDPNHSCGYSHQLAFDSTKNARGRACDSTALTKPSRKSAPHVRERFETGQATSVESRTTRSDRVLLASQIGSPKRRTRASARDRASPTVQRSPPALGLMRSQTAVFLPVGQALSKGYVAADRIGSTSRV
jgi:hypothetical protein